MLLEVILAAQIAGFNAVGRFGEQVRTIAFDPGVTVTIVAPAQLDRGLPTTLIIYALPNGNTTDQTIGKAMRPGDDWHFDIQHIGAQTRMLRSVARGRNLVVAYLENNVKSWPAWRTQHPDNGELILDLLAKVKQQVMGVSDICLTGHSGGGSFTFGFLDAVTAIPPEISRIAFLDSNYSFEETHAPKLLDWLKGDPARRLVVLAYDDRNIELNGKKVVSETGGTYRASFRMAKSLKLESSDSGSYIRFASPGMGPQIEIMIHRNPENAILHTALVGEKNGYLHAMTVGTPWEKQFASLDGPRAYTAFIERAMTGAEFIASVQGLDRAAREEAIRKELLAGNIPSFLRRLVPVTVGDVVYEVMPDYLAIGSDEDFVRMPMNPYTAQAFCDALGFVLPTRKMTDDIWRAATVKLLPQPLVQEREAPATFLQHHRMIEEQAVGQKRGELWAGIKKDVVITNRLQERPNRVAIYGWHYPAGDAIQPLTIVHADWYVDYSHGIRPVKRMMQVGGRAMSYEEILKHPKLHVLLSDEGPIEKPRYGMIESHP